MNNDLIKTGRPKGKKNHDSNMTWEQVQYECQGNKEFIVKNNYIDFIASDSESIRFYKDLTCSIIICKSELPTATTFKSFYNLYIYVNKLLLTDYKLVIFLQLMDRKLKDGTEEEIE